MSIDVVGGFDNAAVERVLAAAGRMYDAEIALHAAHQSHVGAWITAAADRLHEAIIQHTATLQAVQCSEEHPVRDEHLQRCLDGCSAVA